MSTSRVTITGNLTAQPQLREFNDKRKTTFCVASTPSIRDKDTGEYRDGTTTFYNVSCWNRLGENALQSLHKGDPVVVTGRLSVETWQGQDGMQRQSPEILADVVGHDLTFGVASFERPQRGASSAA